MRIDLQESRGGDHSTRRRSPITLCTLTDRPGVTVEVDVDPVARCGRAGDAGAGSGTAA